MVIQFLLFTLCFIGLLCSSTLLFLLVYYLYYRHYINKQFKLVNKELEEWKR